MGVLIDSSILIAYERGRIQVGARIEGRSQESFFLSVVTVSELLHGVHRARDVNIRARRSAFVEGVLERFPILDVDVATARIHSQLWADLEMQGQMIGAHDLWIAASALANGLALATANLREFQRVPGLIVESW